MSSSSSATDTQHPKSGEPHNIPEDCFVRAVLCRFMSDKYKHMPVSDLQAASGQTGAWLRSYAKQAGQSEGDGAGSSRGDTTTSSGDEAAAAAAGTQDSDAEGSSMDVAELQELLQQAQEEVQF